MIVSSFIERTNEFVSRLYWRRWAPWEILTVILAALVLLLWIITRQRSRKVRRVYENQLLESSPVIGANLGLHKRNRHLLGDLKKDRLVPFHKHQKQHSAKTKQPSEKLREEIKQLRYEIIKCKQAEVRLEQQVAQLTADNAKLQSELGESKQDGKQSFEIRTDDEQLRTEVPKVEHDEHISEQQVTVKPAVDRTDKRKSAKISKSYEQRHRVVDGVKQKLCRTCKEWKAESEYHKNSSSKDGLAGACKECKTNAAREYRRRRKAAKG